MTSRIAMFFSHFLSPINTLFLLKKTFILYLLKKLTISWNIQQPIARTKLDVYSRKMFVPSDYVYFGEANKQKIT